MSQDSEQNELSEAWTSLPYSQRLDIAEFLFKQITAWPSCSFRRLIYGRLGFEHSAYVPLYLAGGMEITNAVGEYMDNKKFTPCAECPQPLDCNKCYECEKRTPIQ